MADSFPSGIGPIILWAIIGALAIIAIGSLVAIPISRVFSVDLPPVCEDWNKNYVMEISLGFTGLIAGGLLGIYLQINK